MSKETLTGKEKEAEREDVSLDEAPVEGSSEESPDSSTFESDERHDASSTEEDLTDDNPSAEKPEVPSRKVISRFFRNKWLLLSFAGIVSVVLGIVLGYDLPWNPPWRGQASEGIHGETGKRANGPVHTGLQPFFVPLPAGSENIAIKLDITVDWESGALQEYRERSAFVRNSLLSYFLRVAKSKEGFGVDRSRLESEIGEVLEHSLAVKNIKVTLDSVTPI
jgi:hypothetical protein